jgi:sigma-E factor negative regulatory protein RseC
MSPLDSPKVECGEVVGVGVHSVDVRMLAGAQCAGCNHCSTIDKSGLTLTDVRDDMGARVGDRVEVVVPHEADVRAGLIAYIGPVVALLAGYGAGDLLGRAMGWNTDLTGAVFAVAGVAAGMLLMRSRARRLLSAEEFRPSVRAIIARVQAVGPVSSGPLDGALPAKGRKVRET